MKQLYIIFSFLGLGLFAQVKPPDLRCLEVQGNNVLLKWLTPANNPNQFVAYDIWHQAPGATSYTLAATITTFSVTAFTHIGATGGFYYMITRETGSLTSKSSDTLRSIFLAVIPATEALKFNYNNLHNPKLPSTAATFTIVKEYPVGIFNNLGITPANVYGDTLSVCTATIGYHVVIDDASGCRSISNRVVGTYSDLKAPNKIELDSISVLPNGQTVLSWFVPRDQDLIKYSIQNNHAPYDTVKGRNNTFYTYTPTTANSGTVSLACSGVDSCKNGGSDVYYNAVTMYLQSNYNYCAYRTELNWTPYLWHPERIQEYQIFYSENGGSFKLVGSTSQTSFNHDSVAPGKNVCYFVRMLTKNSKVTSSSNRRCFFSTQVDASGALYIRTATIRPNNSAIINLYLDNTKASNGIDLLRSEDGQTFKNIGFMPYTGGTNYSFTDTDIKSNTKSYTYKAIVKDSCGNPRTVSNLAKTILLKVRNNEENNFTKHLTWNDYEGFGGQVSVYSIYRIINDVRETNPVATVNFGTNSFTDNLEDLAKEGSKIEYFVEATEGTGNPLKFKEWSTSNPVQVYIEGQLFVPNAFCPTGQNKTWLPVTHFIDKNEYRVMVFNRWGQKVFEARDDSTPWTGANSKTDVYMYIITYKNSRGEYQELKGTVMLLE